MPPLTEYNKPNVRSLLFGEPKTKKTWFSVKKPAEAGYNVLLLNGDKGLGREILKDIEPEAASRVSVIDCADSGNYAVFALFMTYFLKGDTIIWDDDDNKLARLKQDPSHNHYVIRPRLLTSKDVVVVDSYTKLVQSLCLQYATEHNIDLSDAQRTDWDGYGWQGRLLDWMMQQLTLFDCNWLWVAHSGLHEHRVKDPLNPRREIIESTSIHPVSSSRPHSMTVGQNFNDILYFTANDGNVFIDTRKMAERDGGSRNIPPAIYNWDDISFEHIAGVSIEPATEFPAVEYRKAEKTEETALPDLTKTNAPLDASNKSTVVLGDGTNGLLNK